MNINFTHRRHNKFNFDYLIVIFLGIANSFSLPPYNYFFLNFLCFPAFFLILSKNKIYKKKSFFIGWFFGFGYFFSSLYWISNSLTFLEDYKFLIPLSLCLIPAGLAIFYGLITMFLSFFNIKKNLSSLMIFSVVFSIIEFLRGIILTGFPWNLNVYSLTEFTKLIQILSIVGTYGLNLICITFFLIPLVFLFEKRLKFKISVFLIFFSIFALNYFYGDLRIDNYNKNEIKSLNTQIKIVSPKIDLNRFLNNEDPIKRIEEIYEISDPNKDLNTLFIFPEGILTGVSLQNHKYLSYLFNNRYSSNHKLLIGMNIVEDSNVYNSLVLFNNKLKPINIYKKNKLVPFGEYLPIEKILSRFGLKKITQGYQSFTPSNIRNVIELDYFSILPLICYEIIYTGNLSKNKNDYDIIVNISEDGWFGDSIGPHQHFSHSLLRSIEEGKNLIRSANNGISALINPVGLIENKVESTESGVIEFNTVKSINTTIFSKHGNKIFFYLMLFYITLIFFLKKKGH